MGMVQCDFTTRAIRLAHQTHRHALQNLPQDQMRLSQDSGGNLIPQMLPKEDWQNFQGVLGHYHVQRNKTDPGPGFNWEKVVGEARDLLE